MKTSWLTPLASAGIALFLSTATLAQDVRVIVSGQVTPGVYGRVEVGTNPPPPVVSPRPVIVTPPVVVVNQPVVVQQPVYMHVPPGHAKKWSKHCHKYQACGQQVYFVKSAEYEQHGKKHGHGHGHGHHKD